MSFVKLISFGTIATLHLFGVAVALDISYINFLSSSFTLIYYGAVIPHVTVFLLADEFVCHLLFAARKARTQNFACGDPFRN